MSVYKTGKSPYWQYDLQWRGSRLFGSTKETNERKALAYEARELARLQSSLADPTPPRPPITFDEACGLYAEHAENLPSWSNIEYMLAVVLKEIGKTKLLSEITQRRLQTFIAKRRAGRSDASVNREMQLLRAIWRRAAGARFDVGEMPDWNLLRLKEVATPPRELDPGEEEMLFAAIRGDLLPTIEFLFLSGWRRSEVIGLCWSDCNLGQAIAQTRIKGGDTVRRALSTRMVAIIANQPRVGASVFTYVCQKSRAKRRKGQRYPMTATVIREAREAWAEAGVEGFRLHDLRHNRVSKIVRATGSLAAAKEAAKHKHIATTMRYTHVLDEDVRNALDASESRKIPGLDNIKLAKG
jgi:integrase